ncbi:MAG TPA: CCA tRNA nucleotidyltransferase [Terriglobales bacterium]|nr:CCA tRNA nucleotidyltransferase [Terriglobales bacterium]
MLALGQAPSPVPTGNSVRDFAIQIVRTLHLAGHKAYLVGGCVRDIVLGRQPADYDVATGATPDQVMRIFPQSYAVGAQFGVVLVPSPDGNEQPARPSQIGTANSAEHQTDKAGVVEVATFRSDIGYSDGRHPDQVRFSSDPKEDVQRRDFTINGLLYDPEADRILDYVGGRADIRSKIIRTIGEPELRFREDKLRMLRAVRFAARFEYQIEPATFVAIQKMAAQIHQVSCERIREELTKMLTEGRARRAFELLDESGLLKEVLPEVSAMKGVEQPPQFHPEGDVWVHTLMLLENLPHPCSKTLAWGALLHDVGKPPTFRVAPDRIRFDNHVEIGVRMAEEICRRLRFSKHETEQIAALVANHMRFADVQRMKQSTLKRFFRLPHFDQHLELHRLDCLSSHGDLTLYEFVREKRGSLAEEQIRPQPLLTGDDLIAAGYPPGPGFKEILSRVEDAQLEGRLQSKDQALTFVREQFPVTA